MIAWYKEIFTPTGIRENWEIRNSLVLKFNPLEKSFFPKLICHDENYKLSLIKNPCRVTKQCLDIFFFLISGMLCHLTIFFRIQLYQLPYVYKIKISSSVISFIYVSFTSSSFFISLSDYHSALLSYVCILCLFHFLSNFWSF